MGEAVDRLCLLWGAVQSEADRLTQARSPDPSTLRRLRTLVQSFKQDAHSLLVAILFEDAPPAMAEVAEDLLEALCDVLDRVDASLACGSA